MKRKVVLAILLPVLAGFAVRASAQEVEASRRHALIIGINKYENLGDKAPNLRFCEHDAEHLAETLGSRGFDSDLVVTLSTSRPRDDARYPTAVNIRKQVKALAGRLKEGDSVVISYAGYEKQYAGNDDYFLCPADGDPDDRHSLVSLREITEVLGRSKAKSKLVLIDSCRVSEGEGTNKAPRPRLGGPSVSVLFACSAGKLSNDLDEKKHGVMSYFLVEGINGAADENGDGAVTTAELVAYVKSRLPKYEQAPELFGPVPPIDFGRIRDKQEAQPTTKPATESVENGEGKVTSRGLFGHAFKELKKEGVKAAEATHKGGQDLANTAHDAEKNAANAGHMTEKNVANTVHNVEKDAAKTGHKTGKDLADATHKAEKDSANLSHRLEGQASEGYHHVSAVAVKAIKESRFYKEFQERALSLFMESPHITKFHEEHAGSPVYYINGMFSLRSQVEVEAEALAKQLKRPIFLILNPTIREGSTGTPHCADDISEAIYDKTWPERLVGVDLSSLLPRLSAPNPPIAQLDPTTRQITHVLYHARGPVSIVSHSQGCLMVRNALLAVALLDQEGKVERELAWVATGTPVNDKEIWPIPARYHYLINATDPVAALIGTRGGPGLKDSLRNPANDHEPIRNYFPRVKPTMLFP